MRLYRPVGLIELQRIYELGMRAFPPRLPKQPIFYPVLNFAYAAQIAREWNTKSNSFAGYVTQFEVDDVYVSRFDRQIVGSRQHEELWVPAEQLKEFNRHILDHILVVAAYFGPHFRGYVPERFMLKGQTASEQFVALCGVAEYSGTDFVCELGANHLAVFLHYPFWQQHDFAEEGISSAQRDRVLTAIKDIWEEAHPGIRLPQNV